MFSYVVDKCTLFTGIFFSSCCRPGAYQIKAPISAKLAEPRNRIRFGGRGCVKYAIV